jgi:hypothetical protein
MVRNPRTWKVETEGAQVQEQPGLPIETLSQTNKQRSEVYMETMTLVKLEQGLIFSELYTQSTHHRIFWYSIDTNCYSYYFLFLVRPGFEHYSYYLGE